MHLLSKDTVLSSCISNLKCFHFVIYYELVIVFSCFFFFLPIEFQIIVVQLTYMIVCLWLFHYIWFLHVNYVFQLSYMPKETMCCNLPSGCHLYTQLTTGKYRKKNYEERELSPKFHTSSRASLYFIIFLSSLQSIDSSCATKCIEFSVIHNIKTVYSFFRHAV